MKSFPYLRDNGSNFNTYKRNGYRLSATNSVLGVGLSHYYRFEEASGPRVDVLGGTSWTVSDGIPGNAVGKVNNGVSVSIGNCLSIPQTSLLTPYFTMAFWVNVSDYTHFAGSDSPIIAAQTTSFGFDFVKQNGANQNRIIGFPNGGSALASGFVSTGSFHAVVLWGGPVSVGVQIDGGPPRTASLLAGGGLQFSSETLKLSFGANAGVSAVFDEMAIWTRILANEDRLAWYNNTLGKFYPY